jgi:hypothetical protein
VFAGGSVPDVVVLGLPPPPVSPFIHIPKITATRMATSSCQVCQLRFSFILSSPGAGGWSASGG